MKQYGYVYYNRKVGAYTPPKFEVYDIDLKKEIDLRGYQLADENSKAEMDECELHYVGIFDDVTGTFDLKDKPEYLLTFGGNKDGGKEK